MFGYLQIDKRELKVREYEAYKSVYCGLCKQMGRDYSFLTRLFLSYDCTFYAMLLMSLSRSCKGFKDGRCRFNPLKKCSFALCESDCYSKAAAFSIISVYYKLQDDIYDSGFFKRTAARFLKLFFGHWRKRAAKRYPELDSIVENMLRSQLEAEHKDSPSIDEAAHPTAEMLAEVMSLESSDDMHRRVFYEFGYNLGRWIYLIDAVDDLEKDRKKNNFNPFINIESDKIYEYISSALNQSLARAYDAYNLIEITDFKGILDNMMLLGFPLKQNSVISSKQEVKNE